MRIRVIEDIDKLEKVGEELFERYDEYWGIDTETTGLDRHTAKLRLVQISTRDWTCVIDLFKLDNLDYFSNWIQRLVDWSTDKNITWCFHNQKFDVQFFWKIGVDFSLAKCFDCMIAAQVIEAGLPVRFSLRAVVDRYLGLDLEKDEQTSDWSIKDLSKSQLGYAAKDADITRRLAIVLAPKLVEEDLDVVFWELEMPCVFATAAMEFYGVYVNKDVIETLRPRYEAKQKQSEVEFLSYIKDRWIKYDLFGDVLDEGLSLSSSSQMLKALQGLGIPDPLIEGELIQSTAATNIKLLDVVDWPVLLPLLDNRKIGKLLTSFIYPLPELINSSTGRVHPGFNQMVSTARFSSSFPNVQQIPRHDGSQLSLRTAFQAQEGNKWSLADFSQQEIRVIAEVCQDKTMIQEFLNNQDCYLTTAAFLNGYTYEELEAKGKTFYKPLRQIAKAVKLGMSYSMWWKKLKNYAKQNYGVTMTDAEAEKYYIGFFEQYPGLKAYHDRFKDKSITEVRTYDRFKRRKQWLEYPGVPALCNMPIQGCLKYETKVLTTKGYIQIGDLYFRDTSQMRVWDGNKWCNFTVLNRGASQLAEIKLKHGKTLNCDIRHEVLVADDEGYKFKHFNDLTEEDKICCSLALPLEYGNNYDTELFYWIGFFLGDGWINWVTDKKRNNKAELRFFFGSVQQGIDSELVKNQVKRCIDYFSNFGYAYASQTKDNLIIVKLHSRRYLRAWMDLYPVGSNCYTKKIPEIIWSSSLSCRIAFLQGVLDSDGYIPTKDRNTGICIHLANKNLIDELFCLAQTCGIPCTQFQTTENAWRLTLSNYYVYKYLDRGFVVNDYIGRRNINPTPKFIIEHFFKDLSEVVPISDRRNRAIILKACKKQNIGIYTIKSIYDKYNIKPSIPLFECINFKSKTILDKEEETFTLSVESDEHWFDSETIISKNTSANMTKLALVQTYYQLYKDGYSPTQSHDVKMILTVH